MPLWPPGHNRLSADAAAAVAALARCRLTPQHRLLATAPGALTPAAPFTMARLAPTAWPPPQPWPPLSCGPAALAAESPPPLSELAASIALAAVVRATRAAAIAVALAAPAVTAVAAGLLRAEFTRAAAAGLLPIALGSAALL
jgi:hypothetical protein